MGIVNDHGLANTSGSSSVIVTSMCPTGEPQPWSGKTFPLVNGFDLAPFDLAPDGKRIVVVMPTSTAASTEPLTHVTFLLNFADELRRKVPVGK